MTFEFYLDAWNYAHKHSIPIHKIKRKTWKQWEITP